MDAGAVLGLAARAVSVDESVRDGMDVTVEWTVHVQKGRSALKEVRTAEGDAEFDTPVERNAQRMLLGG